MKAQHPVAGYAHFQRLLLGLLGGYGIFLAWLGLRWIVLISGAIIMVTTVCLWQFSLTSSPEAEPSAHTFLNPGEFLIHIQTLNDRVSPTHQEHWQSSYQQIIAIEQLVQQIMQQQPSFIPDLLDTLHTVISLAEQLIDAISITQQVRTPYYQKLALQQLHTSQLRLQQTYHQLESLHDQLMVTELEWRTAQSLGGMAERLQVLVAENTQSIQESIQP
ncbi:MAG: hypothetical protein AAFY17_01045 [Cyanobacteria bacterium J06642_11]